MIDKYLTPSFCNCEWSKVIFKYRKNINVAISKLKINKNKCVK